MSRTTVIGLSGATCVGYPRMPASQTGKRAAWLPRTKRRRSWKSAAARRWARTSCGRRSPERSRPAAMRYLHFCAHEQFNPADLLRQAVEAEEAGFDGIGCSDHLQPWWEGGESGNAWVWLGAAAQATQRVPFGTGVTPPGPRYHPLLIAQAWATLEQMYPGRPYLGIGSGESLNESPLGAPWPSVGKQIERMEEALEMIHALYEGKRLSGKGEHFSTDGAYLHTRPER